MKEIFKELKRKVTIAVIDADISSIEKGKLIENLDVILHSYQKEAIKNENDFIREIDFLRNKLTAENA